jgi:NAD+ kinase
MSPNTPPKVYIIANPSKPGLDGPLQHVRRVVAGRGEILDARLGRLDPAISARADRVIVLGGDGTILAAARAMGTRQVPLIGINMGKLGYLAAFNLDELETHVDRVLTDEALIGERMMLAVSVDGGGHQKLSGTAVNDCVVHAGPPFRMISLSISLDGSEVTRIVGDGLIVATPVGSTAYNLSAGGPILQPTVRGIAITPICAHSLTHKPLVVDQNVTVRITPERINEGTRVIVDGQDMLPVSMDDQVTVRRSRQHFLLVENPAYPAWYTLVEKLKWGQATPR